MLRNFKKTPVSIENLKYYKNIFWMFFRYASYIICMVFVSAAVVRYLGREQYGALSYAVSMMAIFFPIATLGIEGFVYRELVLGRHSQGQVLGTAAVLRFFAGLFASSSLLLFSFLYAHEPMIQALLLTVSIVPLIRTLDILEFFFQARSESKRVVLIQAVGFLISSLGRVGLLISHASLVWFGAVVILDYILITGPLIYVYFKTPGRDAYWCFDRPLAWAMFWESWPGFLCLFIWQLGGRVDQILVKNMLGNGELGVYAAAVVLVENLDFIPYIIGGSLFPHLIGAKEDREKYYHSLGRLFELTLIASLILIAIYALAAPLIIHFLFGSRFQGAALVLPLYVLKIVFFFMAYIRGRWLIIENLQLRDLYYRVGTLLLNVILCFLWIPMWGIQGAALAAVVSFAIGLYIIPLADPRLQDVNEAFHQAIRFPILCGVIQRLISHKYFCSERI